MKCKLLIFLLFFSFGFSQTKIPNSSSVTYFKVYDFPDDGPCNPFDNEKGMIVEKKIKNCEDFIFKLIELKKNSLKWEKSESCCVPGWHGCGEIDNKIVYQINGLKDSIYFNIYENSGDVFDLKNNFIYRDKSLFLLKTITSQKDIIDFYNFPHRKELHDFSYSKNDSINSKEIKILNKEVFNKSFENLSVDFENFDEIISKKYKLNELFDDELITFLYLNYVYEFNFNKDKIISRINITKYSMAHEFRFNDEFSIQGIKIGDNESKLIEKFPNSTKYLYNIKKYFTKENETYSVFVGFEKAFGGYDIEFIIENEIIKEIIIDF